MPSRYSYHKLFLFIIHIHLIADIIGLLCGLFTTYTLTDCHIRSIQDEENKSRHRFLMSSLPGSNPTIFLDPNFKFTSTVMFFIMDIVDILLTFLLFKATNGRKLRCFSLWVQFSTVYLFCQLLPLPFLINYFLEVNVFWLHVAVFPFYAVSVWFVNSYRNYAKTQDKKWAKASAAYDLDASYNGVRQTRSYSF